MPPQINPTWCSPMSLFKRCSLLAIGAAALLSLTACGGGEDVQEYYGSDTNPAAAIDIAPVPPPAQTDEEKTGLTDPRTQVWRPGHWVYESQRFQWVSGEVLTRPSPTAVWSPDRWERRAYGWVFIHGYWQ